MLFAALLLLEKWVLPLDKLPGLLRRVYVLLAVCLSFVLFNAVDLKQAASDLAGMFGFGGYGLVSAETLYYLKSYGLLFLAGFVGATPLLRDGLNKLEKKETIGKVLAVLEPVVMAAIPPISVLSATPMALVMDLGSRDRIITRSRPKSFPAMYILPKQHMLPRITPRKMAPRCCRMARNCS